MTAQPACQCEGVSVRRRGREVLREISFSMGTGEFVALIGANGSGKTTLLRTLMGFLRPAAGRVTLFGESGPVSLRLQRKQIGCVPQSPDIDFKMPISVRDVVLMGRLTRRGPGRRLQREDRAAAERALTDVGLLPLANRPIGHLSGGELQKVQIARALCQSPRLLLLDEPTGNLDLGAQRECLDLISALHDNRALTTFIVMHDLKSLPAGCTRAMILDQGELVYDGPFGDLFTEENIAHVYKRQGPTIWSELLAELPHKGEGDA